MPILDRSWWLWWLAALYVVAGVALFAYWAYTGPYLRLSIGCLAGIFGVVLVIAAGVVAWLLLRGFQARERKLRRVRAIRGDPDAMPLARMGADSAHLQFVKLINARAAGVSGAAQGTLALSPAVSETPLTLLWRWPTIWESPAGGEVPRWRALSIAAGPFLVCGLVGLGCGWFASGWLSAALDGQLDLGRFLWLEGPSFLLWPYLIFMLWHPNAQSAVLRPFRRSPFGIVATNEGVEERTRFGDRHFVRWEDARLLEVRFGKENNVETGYQYILYSRSDALAWSITFAFLAPRETAVPDGISREEVQGRGRQLIDLIAARCGLVARTLDPKLQTAPEH